VADGYDQLKSEGSYSAAFERLRGRLGSDWHVTDWNDRKLQWRFFSPGDVTGPGQGWKIHVTASAAESPQLLTCVATELCRLRVPFKIPRRAEDVVFINSGDDGAELLGKIITAYPRDNEQARAAIIRCDQLWPVSKGPEVQTDLHLRPNSAVSFRYGVFRAQDTVISSTGIYRDALRSTDGFCAPDKRSLDGGQSPTAPSPPFDGIGPTRWPVSLKEAYRVGDADYVALANLGETPRARTYLAADVDTLETVVLKVCRRGVAGDLSGHDAADMLRKEFSVLRQLEAVPGLAPIAVQWSSGKWPTLVMQDMRGTVVSQLPRLERIATLPLLADAIVRLHEFGFVHGDVKLENAILRDSCVGLIDFELTARIGEPMRSAGTRGHRAPEIESHSYLAEASRDVFALAGCVVQAILDIPPGLISARVEHLRGLLRNEKMISVADIITPWLDMDPVRRPTARSAASALRRHAKEFCGVAPDDGRPSSESERRWCARAGCEASRSVRSYSRVNDVGMRWKNMHFMRSFECEGINLGAAGIVLGLVTIDQALSRRDHTEEIELGASWLAQRPANGNAAGLFTGNAGVSLAVAVAGLRLGRPSFLVAARQRFEMAAADHREIDLFSGTAGVVWAATLLAKTVQKDWPIEVAKDAAIRLNECAVQKNGLPVWSLDLDHDTTYLGCAHGSAGIALALACWGRATGDSACTETARETFRQIALHGRTEDGSSLRIGPDNSRHYAVGNWCHGVAGYLWAILNAVGDDPELSREIDWSVGVLRDALSVGTPTYCHGLAGQLELWRMLQRIPRFRALAESRAGKVARALRVLHVKIDGRCVWTSDDPDIVTPDLWIGFLGPATALVMHAARVKSSLLSGHWLTECSVRPRMENRVAHKALE